MTSQSELWQQMATPTRFAMTVSKDFMGQQYVPYPWILWTEKKILEAIADPAERFIILNVPPQSGKTTTFGMFLPGWYLGMYPNRQVIFVTYSETYSESWGLKTRNLLNTYGKKYFGVEVSNHQAAANNWKTSQGFGGMLSVGIGGGITGNPGHLIIIDDVIKTMEEASSVTLKRKHLAEYDGSISTRFQPGSTVLITATRFAEDDLSGALIDRMDKEGYDGDKWEVISIPAIAEPPDDLSDDEREQWVDFLGRHAGEALEGRYTRAFYEKRKASIDPFAWSAVYQQQPSVAEGGMFPKGNWRFYDGTPPLLERRVRAWDLATTEGGGDWTVGTLMGAADNGDLYVLDVKRVQRNSAAVEQLVQETAMIDGYEVKILIEQEKAGAGRALVEHYQRLLRGYQVEPAKIDGSKEVRARPYSAMQNSGRVWLPKDRVDLCKSWIEEHAKMMGDGRRPRHDDQIDTAAYCCMELISIAPTAMWVPGEDPEDLASNAMYGQMRSLNGKSIFDRIRA